MKIHISINEYLESGNITSIYEFPDNYIIDFALDSYEFRDLFFDFSKSQEEKFQYFFSQSNPKRHYIYMVSRLASMILNTYNDIDINPLILKQAISSSNQNENDVQIYDYFFKSIVQDNLTVSDIIRQSIEYVKNAFENSIDSGTSFEAFLKVGDSVYIEGSLLLPTTNSHVDFTNSLNNVYIPIHNGNLPVIIKFTNSKNIDVYDSIQTDELLQNKVDVDIFNEIVNQLQYISFTTEALSLKADAVTVSNIESRVFSNESRLRLLTSTETQSTFSKDLGILGNLSLPSHPNIDSSITTIENDITHLETTSSTIESDITVLKTRVTNTETNTTDNQNTIIDLETRLLSTETSTSTLEQDITDLGTRVTQTETTTSSNQSDIADLQTQVSQIQNDADTLETSVADIEKTQSDINDFSTRLLVTETSMNLIQGNVTDLDTRVTNTETIAETIQSNVTDLITRVTDSETIISTNLQNDITTLQTNTITNQNNITNLETRNDDTE